jgi:peptide/nickel transport system substrate-binding protein
MWKRLVCAAIIWTAAPAIWAAAPAAAETTLNVAASADLVTLDPTGTASTNVYTHGFMVYDTLFAPDENLHIHPQMVGDETISADRLTCTLTLRPGLLFHDGSKVTTRDVIASLQRWMRLDIVGRTMASDVQSMTATSASTFAILLKRPFPVEQALANSGSGLGRTIQARHANHRIGTLPVRPERLGTRRPSGVRTVRRLCAS